MIDNKVVLVMSEICYFLSFTKKKKKKKEKRKKRGLNALLVPKVYTLSAISPWNLKWALLVPEVYKWTLLVPPSNSVCLFADMANGMKIWHILNKMTIYLLIKKIHVRQNDLI